MSRTVYNFDKEERLTRVDMESGYSVAKSLNNLYEKHSSLNKKATQSPGSKLLESSSLIRNRDGNKIEKNDVCLSAKQMGFVDMLVRQKTCMLLTLLNETMNLNLKKQMENQRKTSVNNNNDNNLLFKNRHTNKRLISNQSALDTRKKLTGVSPLICKSSSSINLSFQNHEPFIIKPRRRLYTSSIHDNTKPILEKKDLRTRSKQVYSNKYGKSRSRKQRQLTIMMRINEESENEIELDEEKIKNKSNETNFNSNTKHMEEVYRDYRKIMMLMT